MIVAKLASVSVVPAILVALHAKPTAGAGDCLPREIDWAPSIMSKATGSVRARDQARRPTPPLFASAGQSSQFEDEPPACAESGRSQAKLESVEPAIAASVSAN